MYGKYGKGKLEEGGVNEGGNVVEAEGLGRRTGKGRVWEVRIVRRRSKGGMNEEREEKLRFL